MRLPLQAEGDLAAARPVPAPATLRLSYTLLVLNLMRHHAGTGGGKNVRWRGQTARAAVVCTAALLHAALVAGQPSTFSMPSFGQVMVYAPTGPPDQVVLFVSGDGGWNLGVVSMAESLREAGALVVGIDIRRFLRSLDSGVDCAYPAGPLEELSRAVQGRWKVAEYRRPILVGYSSGATLVYAALAAAPTSTFAGAISLGFCPDLEMRTAPCQVRGLRSTKKVKGVGYILEPDRALSVPWMVLQGEVNQACDPEATRAFVAGTGEARLFSLPRVGHGFAVAKNWEPQMLEAYRAIVVPAACPVAAVGGDSRRRPPTVGGGAGDRSSGGRHHGRGAVR